MNTPTAWPIAILMHHSRELDFYAQILKELPSNQCRILIDDFTEEKNINQILAALHMKNWEYETLSSWIEFKHSCSVFLATKDFQARFRAYKPFGYKESKDFKLRRSLSIRERLMKYTVNTLMPRSALLQEISFIRKKRRDIDLRSPNQLGIHRVMFPRGIDLSNKEPEDSSISI